jgi:hypothetical protein
MYKNNKKKKFCSPLVRKLHLVVTAVREFIQAIDSYKLIPYLSPEDKVSRRYSYRYSFRRCRHLTGHEIEFNVFYKD